MSTTPRSPVVSLDRRHIWHPFTQEHTAPDPLEIRAAQDAVLFGADGREYLDLISSWWVTLHGHAHPAIADAIGAQAHTLEQVIFAGITHEPAVRLAAELANRLPGDLERVFFSDDGSTAIEVAMKLACQAAFNRGERRTRFLTFAGGYHGDTVGAMSAGATSGFFAPFEPLLFDVTALPYPQTWDQDPEVEHKERQALDALDQQLHRHHKDIAALLIEPLVQGAGGMRMARPDFVRAVTLRCRAAGVPVIYDEVMTGFGRTGTLFAAEQVGVAPDIVCLSKGLTAGFLAMSVTVCSQAIYQQFLGDQFDKAFTHGHSFTANPLGCAAGLASLAVFDTDHTLQRIQHIADRHAELAARLERHPRAHRIRRRGTIIAFDVKDPATGGYHSTLGPKLKAFFLQQGLLIRPLGNVVYLLPPYCITDAQLDQAYEGVVRALDCI